MKKALPANAKISKDAKETVQECISEFISLITGDDLLWAMTTLGFEEYVEPLKVYLLRFRDMEGEICCVLFGVEATGEPKNFGTKLRLELEIGCAMLGTEIKEWDFPEEELESNDLGSRNLS
ncbi:nuclear transcription factor Y subunit B-3-like [Camellia sinensis]|uniref:nuclear transcription factor Y subunit B-3-like n=1 Tax=Camellia sinensis TaxID=4442 RepID=UPI0010357646|nr:nuclear transcription factor Y subunit B-3-like [Camellia sinensis]